MRRTLLALTTSLLSAFIIHSAALAQLIPVNVVQQIGTVQQQDIEDARRLEQERRGLRDYQNHQKKEEQKDQKQTPKREESTEKAKPSEYKTKGVYIEKIEIPESQILTQKEIDDIVNEYEKTNLTMADIKQLVEKINELYFDKGFVTARAYLPEQTVENGTLQIAIMEGKVGKITIEECRWTKESHIIDRLDVKEGEIFNIQELENKIMIYNRYNDGIMITGDLNPGQKEGTTDVVIKTTEKAPYHLTAVTDNFGRDTIGKNRAGIVAAHDSLFGYRDRLSAGIYANRYSMTPFVDYNIPVNKYDGRVGVSFSYNKAKIGHGGYQDFNIESRSQNYSIYYTHPFIRELHDELNGTVSYTYKHAVTSFDDKDLYKDKIPELKVGLGYRHDTDSGIWYLAQSVSYAAPWYQDRIDYWKFEGSATRLHDFGYRILGYFRGNYQYIHKDVVPYADQMSVGGYGTVRGYSQGVVTAKSGYQLGAEVYFPIAPEKINIGDKVYRSDEYVRPFVFTDYAALYPYRGKGGGNKSDILHSAGAGLRIQLPYDVALKVAYGVPLRHNKYDKKSGGAWCLELSFSPDFNRFFSK